MKNDNWTSETAPKGKGRGVTKYFYTQIDIALCAGKALQTIRNDIAREVFDPNSLGSVCRYCGGST